MNNNAINNLTTETITTLVQERQRSSTPQINRNEWLTNYSLELNQPLPLVENTIDQSSIENLNQNLEVVNNLITATQQQNLNNQLFVNENNLHISQNFIDQIQNILNNNPSQFNNYLLSLLLNNNNVDQLIIQIRERLRNFNENQDFDDLIRPLLNSFYLFLETQFDSEIVILQEFNNSLSDIINLLDTVRIQIQNSQLTNQLIQNNNINLDQYVTTIENILQFLSGNREQNLQDILNNTEIQMEEARLETFIQNLNINESANAELSENNDQTKEILSSIKKEILEKLKKIFSQKKSFLMICIILLASQTGIFLPVNSILRIGSNIINSNNTIPISSMDLNSISSNEIRLRDVYDLAVNKLFEFVKNYRKD